MKKYITLEEAAFRWFFDSPQVLEEDLKNILALSPAYSSDYWAENISTERHLMLDTQLKNRFSFIKADYQWEDDWNNDKIKNFAAFLKENTDIGPEEKIFFFWNRNVGVETSWNIFLKNWINFLFDDEAPILLCPATGFALLFGPGGVVFIGEKVD